MEVVKVATDMVDDDGGFDILLLKSKNEKTANVRFHEKDPVFRHFGLRSEGHPLRCSSQIRPLK